MKLSTETMRRQKTSFTAFMHIRYQHTFSLPPNYSVSLFHFAELLQDFNLTGYSFFRVIILWSSAWYRQPCRSAVSRPKSLSRHDLTGRVSNSCRWSRVERHSTATDCEVCQIAFHEADAICLHYANWSTFVLWDLLVKLDSRVGPEH